MTELALVPSCTVVRNVEEHAAHLLRVVAINTVCLVLAYSSWYLHDIPPFSKYCNREVEGLHAETRSLSGGNDLSCKTYRPLPFSFVFGSQPNL